MTGKENRAFPRFLVSTDTCAIYGEGAGAIRDLSLGGVFVVDPEPFPIGTSLNIELRFGDHAIPAQGVVRRSVPGVGMGIQFLEISPAVRARLKLYLLDQVGERARVQFPPGS